MESKELTTQEELSTYIRARYPLIWIDSQEEQRVEAAIGAVAESLSMDVHLWSITSGFVNIEGVVQESVLDPQAALIQIGNASRRRLYVMRDFHPFFKEDNPANVPIIRTARELARMLKRSDRESNRTVIFLSSTVQIPADLQSEIATLTWPLPDETEIERGLKEMVSGLPPQIIEGLPSDMSPVVRAARGLTLEESGNCFARSLVMTKTLDPAVVAAEKKQAIAQGGLLEWIDPDAGLKAVGGMDALKRWLKEREGALSEKARTFGLPAPKGLLMVGVAGAGKSLTAKAVAAEWNWPLLRLDVGRLYGGLLGESESNQRKAIQMAEAAAPCVLWLDEIEKALSGSGGGESDGGAAKRMLSGFLTWMQEKTAPVFVVATANDVTGLPPELLRKGRWDDIFFVDLPVAQERADIWKIHIEKRGRKPDAFDIDKLVSTSADMSGAEIESSFIDAMFVAFAEDSEVETRHVLDVLGQVVPLAKSAAEKVDAVRSWARGRARRASSVQESAGSKFGGLEF